jgi:hypothetical protein
VPCATSHESSPRSKQATARKGKYIGQIVHGGKAYPGKHPAIVKEELFERVARWC